MLRTIAAIVVASVSIGTFAEDWTKIDHYELVLLKRGINGQYPPWYILEGSGCLGFYYPHQSSQCEDAASGLEAQLNPHPNWHYDARCSFVPGTVPGNPPGGGGDEGY